MRAEDVKPGMWLRDSDETFQVTGHIDDLWFRIAYLDGRSGMMERAYARQVEPWVPRVGEWVRRTAEARAHSGPCRSDDGFRVARVFPTEVQSDEGWCLGSPWLEPCAPSEAKPAPRVRAESTLEIEGRGLSGRVLGVFEDFEEAMSKNDLYPYQSGSGTYFSNEEASIILGEWHRGRDQEREAAIETLRSMLMEHACGLAEGARELRRDGEDTTDLEHGACIAIALALLL